MGQPVSKNKKIVKKPATDIERFITDLNSIKPPSSRKGYTAAAVSEAMNALLKDALLKKYSTGRKKADCIKIHRDME